MATQPASRYLTPEQFYELYPDGQLGDRRYEYWDGEAIERPVATTEHALLQTVLLIVFREIGLRSAPEVTTKLTEEKHPVPDVVADIKLERPYPHRPFLVAVEILSDDKARELRRKLQYYAACGIPHVYVFDPIDRTAERWNASHRILEPISEIAVEGYPSISVARIWDDFEKELSQTELSE
jgi:Uma2 family endonuclease